MNREAEIERCADDVLQMAEYGQIESCTFKAKQVMEALRQALELPKQEEPVAYVSKMALEALASNTITSARVWGKENIDPSDEIPLYTSPQYPIVDNNKEKSYG